jgi:EmrB/QacA subfamily drug resistance transporter
VVHRDGEPEHGPWWTLTAACLAVFALLVNVTVVAVALPAIEQSLGGGFTSSRWVVSGYALALATLILGAGSLADLFGHRRVFIIGLVLFLVASAACGAAPSATLLVTARVAQGASAALLYSTSLALIAGAFPGRERARALGIWAVTVGVATSIGPLLGGAFVELASWRWIFFVNIPVVLLAMGLVLTRVRVGTGGVRAPIDWPGQACGAGALFLLVFAVMEAPDRGWASVPIVATLCAGAALLGLFVAIERRVRHPMLDLRLLRHRGALGGALAALTIHASFFSMFVFLAIYLQSVLGYSPLETGLVLVPPAAATAASGAFAGRFAERVGVVVRVTSGTALIGVGLLLLHGLAADTRWTALLPGLLVGGVGAGIANPAIMGAALGAVEPTRSGIASALNVTFRQLGTAVGVAGLGTMLHAQAQGRARELLVAGGQRAADAVDHAAVGDMERAGTLAPGELRAQVLEIGRTAFADGLDDVLLVSAGLAALGALAALTLLRGVREARAVAAPEPETVHEGVVP